MTPTYKVLGSRLSALGVLFIAACSGAADGKTDSASGTSAPAAAAAAVRLTDKVIIVDMVSDEKGNYYRPKEIEAHRGDVIRFVLKTGVHNVHFLADSNPGKSDLPPASEFLQIPGQTWDFVVGLKPGHYVFQCDPHAALGMFGRLEVEGKDDK